MLWGYIKKFVFWCYIKLDLKLLGDNGGLNGFGNVEDFLRGDFKVF